MRRSLLLALALTVLPAVACAEGFTTSRMIELPSIEKPTSAVVDLDLEAMQNPNVSFLVIDAARRTATGSARFDDMENIMPKAVFDSFPPSADTVPKTTITMLQDERRSTAFQPQTAMEYVFTFHFPQTVAPTELRLDLDYYNLASVRVRSGQTASSLKEAFVGSPTSSTIPLSGERGRFFEVTIRIREGVLRVAELSLMAPRTRILFLALPKHTYVLLYGETQNVPSPPLYGASLGDALRGTLDTAQALLAAQRNDYDGIPSSQDNCPDTWNPKLEDFDKDGRGDACDTCPRIANPDQKDANGNGIGDVCEDEDRDGIANAVDNCPAKANRLQEDEDQDGTGNVCDVNDDRWSEDRPWLLYASMGAIIVVITGLGAVILKRSKP